MEESGKAGKWGKWESGKADLGTCETPEKRESGKLGKWESDFRSFFALLKACLGKWESGKVG